MISGTEKYLAGPCWFQIKRVHNFIVKKGQQKMNPIIFMGITNLLVIFYQMILISGVDLHFYILYHAV